MLHRSPILIVEDDPLIAFDLKTSVEDAGGTVVGPVGSVRAALKLLESADVAAAILDVQLNDGDVTPVAALLNENGIPIVLQSGVALPSDLKCLCPGAAFYEKPAPTGAIVERLAVLIRS